MAALSNSICTHTPTCTHLMPAPPHPPQPFSRNLWLVLVFGILFTSILLYILEPGMAYEGVDGGPEESADMSILKRAKRTVQHVAHLFYQGWLLGTVQDAFVPRTPWTKLYLM